jgi:imidazolonepropionase
VSAGEVDLLINPIGELATPLAESGPIHGAGMGRILRLKNAALAVRDGKFVEIGPCEEVLKKVKVGPSTKVIRADRKLVTPGLVDPHTHLIFAGNRANEFMMRCQGHTYAEIARAGGGIVASMRATRTASTEDLIDTGLKRLRRLLESGTTTCEIKTGYGLDFETELRMLKVAGELSRRQPVEIVPTFMAAHAIPPGSDRAAYVEEITNRMLPAVAEMATAEFLNGASAIYNDVFCDEGYFNLEETRAILTKGMQLGLRPKVHADEFANLGATALAVELKASSADHLLSISNYEIELLSGASTVAVLLPGTSFYLNLVEHAPARKMIESGVAVALGSDFNPGSCHIFSLPLICGLACLHLKMTVEEALTALTANAAYAIGCGDKVGQLKAGYQADFVIYDVESLEEIPYNLGWNPVMMTFKRGQAVCDRSDNLS